jgi:hypothetical protein
MLLGQSILNPSEWLIESEIVHSRLIILSDLKKKKLKKLKFDTLNWLFCYKI